MAEPAWKLFDRVADEYDQVAPFFAEFGTAIMEVLDPPAGCRFLDLGSGRGALTAPALARGCVVTAVDASPAMVKRLTAAYPAVTAHVMDVQALALPEGGFDLVGSSFVIHVLDDPAAGVAEAYRVLAPGGRFAFTGGSARTGGGGGAPSVADETSLGSRLNGLFGRFAAYLDPDAGMGRPVDAADLLEEAGFVDLREDSAQVAITFRDGEMLWQWAMSHGYRAFIEALPDDRRQEFYRGVLELAEDDRVLRRTTGVWSGRKPG
ncbi:class I SAM-dependent methyltransferase [Catellatospora tritici]|uniref:class I SAM-dependent methyltransferase n=1 Tax=Catellatospora tritici TaxID=2851566 RepID=UPI001C2D5A45|nr:class I SAM-dependent methyltransferase [Catellatospora tritici]MBV1850855.1 methyltransferase domain-containing protein [Catellatospora tritici]MBV1851108.1 methyltransferase domain-containing protein [Catellatospora tritici]